jgi:transcription elongation factor GreA
MSEHHLSPQAHQRLQDELAERSGPRRKDISAWIERAREHGDIRENADYDAAKNEQGHNEARIRHLEQLLKTAVVVDGPVGDVVAPGTVVEIRMEGDDDTSKYLVGSIEERHDDFDVLSTSSPLGQALLGHGPGDTVSYEGPRRTFAVEIVAVRSA